MVVVSEGFLGESLESDVPPVRFLLRRLKTTPHTTPPDKI